MPEENGLCGNRKWVVCLELTLFYIVSKIKITDVAKRIADALQGRDARSPLVIWSYINTEFHFQFFTFTHIQTRAGR